MPLLTNTDRRTRTTARECSLSFQRHDANLSSLVTIALENELSLANGSIPGGAGMKEQVKWIS